MSQKNPAATYHERILPNQAVLTEYYVKPDYERTLFEGVCRWSRLEPNNGLIFSEASELSQIEGGCDPLMLGFLSFLVKFSNAKRILEIGSFIGVSAISFAKALPPDGQVITIEKYSKFAAIARDNVERNNLSNKVKVLEGDANKVVGTLPPNEKFDIIFIDGHKENYLDLFLMSEPLLAAKGLVLVDDCFFQGDALNEPPTTPKGAGVRAFLEHASRRTDYQPFLLPLCNGLMMMTKR